MTLRTVYKEHEGVYTVRLKTWDGIVESSAYVYVEGEDHRRLAWLATGVLPLGCFRRKAGAMCCMDSSAASCQTK